jgi:hypothetical protein
MSTVIRVLEELGRHPGIRMARNDEYAVSIDAAAPDAGQRQAFLDRDAKALGDLAGARDTLRCLIATPE